MHRHTHTHTLQEGPLSAGQQVLDYKSRAIQSAAFSYLYLTSDQTDSLKAPLIAAVMRLLKPEGFFTSFIDFSAYDTNKKIHTLPSTQPSVHPALDFFLFLSLPLLLVLLFTLSPHFITLFLPMFCISPSIFRLSMPNLCRNVLQRSSWQKLIQFRPILLIVCHISLTVFEIRHVRTKLGRKNSQRNVMID